MVSESEDEIQEDVNFYDFVMTDDDFKIDYRAKNCEKL